MSEPPLEHCIHCGAHAERLLSAGAGLIFKGSGFYITDYARSDSYKKAAETDKGGSTPPAKPADSGGTGSSGDTSGKGGTSTATGASGTA